LKKVPTVPAVPKVDSSDPDADLAILYGVSVGRLNEAVKRNCDRYPNDFMFQLSPAEFHNLKLQ
jgi:hypothetical protein